MFFGAVRTASCLCIVVSGCLAVVCSRCDGLLFVALLCSGCWSLWIACRLTMMCVVVVCWVADGWRVV